jgi:hypothetical protein
MYFGNGSSAVLEGVTVSGNVADLNGGGLYGYYADSLFLAGVVVEDNEATNESGGGLGCRNCDGVSLVRVWLFENLAGADGGGLFLDSCDAVEASDMVAASNTALEMGGGLYIGDAAGELSHLRLTGNLATDGGGAAIEDASLDLDHVILAGNEADGDGGGLLLSGGNAPTLDHAAIVGNLAGGAGGGVYADSGAAVLSNVSVSGNAGDGVTSAGATWSFYYCNAWGNSPADYAGMTAPTGNNGNVSVDPAHASTAAADPLEWDLHLQVGSDLIDAGDGTDPDGGPADIGAYGGSAAGMWDLDGDGDHEWWQPGPYDPITYPGDGWDCDDLDAGVWPGNGC